LIKSVKEDTEAIKTDTIIIKQDTSQIAGLVQEIGLLRLQISHLEDHGGSGGLLLERFLAQSTTYAESVADTGDFDAVEFRRDPASLMPEEGGASDLESTHASDDLDEPDRAREIHSRHNREQSQQTSPFPMRQPLPLAAAPIVPQARDAHGLRPPDHFPVDLPADPPKGGNPLISQSNEPKGRKPQSQLDRKAIEIAARARGKLSEDEKRQLDKELLLLLEGNQNWRSAVPGANFFNWNNVGTLSEVMALLDRGADPSAQTGAGEALKNIQCPALLIEIKSARRLEVIQLLLSRGADANGEGNNYYDSPLHAAASNRNLPAIELLVNYGADVNAQSNYFGNALHGAAVAGNLPAVELLVKLGADVNARGGYYGNALQAASCLCTVDAVRILLAHGADVNARGGAFSSALIAASSLCKVENVRTLLEHGADVHVSCDGFGSALDRALRYQYATPSDKAATIDLLRKHGATEM
jgi:ankyrin repeat protein